LAPDSYRDGSLQTIIFKSVGSRQLAVCKQFHVDSNKDRFGPVKVVPRKQFKESRTPERHMLTPGTCHSERSEECLQNKESHREKKYPNLNPALNKVHVNFTFVFRFHFAAVYTFEFIFHKIIRASTNVDLPDLAGGFHS
jgi:hypothetical protein